MMIFVLESKGGSRWLRFDRESGGRLTLSLFEGEEMFESRLIDEFEIDPKTHPGDVRSLAAEAARLSDAAGSPARSWRATDPFSLDAEAFAAEPERIRGDEVPD